MVANEAVGGGVAERIVEFGRALQVSEHDGDPADLGIVAGTQQLLGGEPAEGRHGDHAFARSARPWPSCGSRRRNERPVGLVADRQFIVAARFFKQMSLAARHDRRDDTVGADIAVGFAAGLRRFENGKDREPRIGQNFWPTRAATSP